MKSISKMARILSHCSLIDAEFRNRSTLGRFTVPTPEQLRSIEVGSFVKIGIEFPETPSTALGRYTIVGGERFWVIIEKITPEFNFMGVIDNDLIYSDRHGVSCGEKICFSRKNIIEVADEII